MKKLKLSRETLRHLADSRLKDAFGGTRDAVQSEPTEVYSSCEPCDSGGSGD